MAAPFPFYNNHMLKAVIFDWAYTLCDWRKRELYPNTKRVLEALVPKYKLAVVALASDSDFEGRRNMMRETGIDHYFSTVLIDSKDKDALYERALKELGCTANEVVVVDDRPIRGIKRGNRHGAMTIWVDRREITHEIPSEDTGMSTHTITDIGEVLKYL